MQNPPMQSQHPAMAMAKIRNPQGQLTDAGGAQNLSSLRVSIRRAPHMNQKAVANDRHVPS